MDSKKTYMLGIYTQYSPLSKYEMSSS